MINDLSSVCLLIDFTEFKFSSIKLRILFHNIYHCSKCQLTESHLSQPDHSFRITWKRLQHGNNPLWLQKQCRGSRSYDYTMLPFSKLFLCYQGNFSYLFLYSYIWTQPFTLYIWSYINGFSLMLVLMILPSMLSQNHWDWKRPLRLCSPTKIIVSSLSSVPAAFPLAGAESSSGLGIEHLLLSVAHGTEFCCQGDV